MSHGIVMYMPYITTVQKIAPIMQHKYFTNFDLYLILSSYGIAGMLHH